MQTYKQLLSCKANFVAYELHPKSEGVRLERWLSPGTLPEDLGLLPNIHIEVHNQTEHQFQGDLMTFFWLLQTLYTQDTDTPAGKIP